MSWEDREYASPSRGGGAVRPTFVPQGRPRSVVTTLIIINVVVYVLCVLGTPRGQAIHRSALFAWCAMITEYVMGGQVWRIVTSDYLHWGTMHLFMNMLGLHFLGRPLEQLWGGRRFFAVYSIAGILGSLFFMVLTLTGWLPSGVAAGASGCVLGLLGAAAVLFPHAEVYIYFLFPVKIRVVAMVLCAWYVLNIFQTGSNAGGDACHLAGLAFGVWWAMKGEHWWAGRRRQGRAQTSRVIGFKRRMAQRRDDAQLIDAILSKVHASGVASLTERERKALAAATKRQQAEEAELDRLNRL